MPPWLYISVVACFIIGAVAIAKIAVNVKSILTLHKRKSLLLEQKAQFGIGHSFEMLKEDWGRLEGQIPNLKQVIVVADRVQAPQNSLATSVLENFKKGVTYTFIVSKSRAKEELDGYLKIFQALAEIAISRHELRYSVDDLVKIHSFADDWSTVPIVFYRVAAETGSNNERLRTTAFWGNKEQSGIAESYQVIPAQLADALAISLVSGSEHLVKKALAEIDTDIFSEKITQFPQKEPLVPLWKTSC